MTRNEEFQAGQGNRITDTTDPERDVENARVLKLHTKDFGENTASLEYHTDPIGVAYIDYIRSPIDNKGHASTLLEHLYRKYPSHNIDWGEILHPAASHLYEKFSNKYGRSFSWDDWD